MESSTPKDLIELNQEQLLQAFSNKDGLNEVVAQAKQLVNRLVQV